MIKSKTLNSKQIQNTKSKISFSITFDFAIEVLFLLVVFLIPVIFDRRLGIVFSGTKTAFLRSLVVIILSAWAVKLTITREHRFVRTVLDWPVMAFLLATTVATLTSVHTYTSFVGFYGRYEGLSTWYLFGLLFFIGTNYLNSFNQFKRIIVTATSAATLMAVYSIIQRHELDPYLWGGVVTWQRVIGMIGQPNFLAAYMLMAFFLGLSLFLMHRSYEKPINWAQQLYPLGYFIFVPAVFLIMIYTLEANNVFLWYAGFAFISASAILFTLSYESLHPYLFDLLLGFCLTLNYICILYTQSRGGYLGFFTGGVLFVLVAGRKFIFANWEKLAVLGAAILLISAITMLRPEYSPFKRFAEEVSTTKETVAPGEVEAKLELKGAAGSRGETWKSAFKIVADYPVFGIGPEVLKMVFPRYETELFRFKEAFHVKQDRCHNETFDVPVTKGLVSFFFFGWIIYSFFQGGLVGLGGLSGEKRILTAGILSAGLAYLIQNQFSFGVVAITSLFWVILSMAANLHREEVSAAEAKPKEIPYFALAGIGLLAAFLIYVSFFSFRGDIYFKAGKTFLEMRRLPEAIADLKRSIEVFPFEGTAISHLAIAQLNAGQIDDAIKTLKYGAQVDPYNADNFFMLAKTSLMLGRDEEAFSSAQTAVAIDPYYAEVFQLLGFLYEKKGNLQAAADSFEKSFMINPGLTESLEKLGEILMKQGKIDSSLEHFQRVLLTDPKNIGAHFGLSQLYRYRGNRAKAKEELEQVLQLDPNHAAAKEALKKL